MVALNWMYSNALGGIKVVVREEDYDAAADILDFPAEESHEPAEEPKAGKRAPIPARHCPACGLTTVIPLRKTQVFTALAVHAAAVGVVLDRLDVAIGAIVVLAIVFVATPSQRCRSCGKLFEWPRAGESPLPAEVEDNHCPRCGSPEIYRIYYRRLKVLSMFEMLGLIVLAPWPFLPKRKCDACGFKSH